jgi:hypothetical protein
MDVLLIFSCHKHSLLFGMSDRQALWIRNDNDGKDPQRGGILRKIAN